MLVDKKKLSTINSSSAIDCQQGSRPTNQLLIAARTGNQCTPRRPCMLPIAVVTVLQLALWHFPVFSYLYFWESRTLRAFPARVHSGPLSSRTRQQSEPHHLMNRLISLRGGFWKNQFHTSRMTTSVRNPSLTIGMNN